MAGSTTDHKFMSLKIMVDTQADKVVFAEAGKEFVDFIFHIMSLPLVTVGALLKENKKEMTGSFVDLYNSIVSLDAIYLETGLDKSSMLKPMSVVDVPMLSSYVHSTRLGFFVCKKSIYQNYACDRKGNTCPCCNGPLVWKKFEYILPKGSVNGIPGYVKGPMSFVVMDNLEVKPMSVALITSLLKVSNSILEKRVQLGQQEGIAILKASLETKSVLTTVFLGSKNG